MALRCTDLQDGLRRSARQSIFKYRGAIQRERAKALSLPLHGLPHFLHPLISTTQWPSDWVAAALESYPVDTEHLACD
jgi:hypothetical protein